MGFSIMDMTVDKEERTILSIPLTKEVKATIAFYEGCAENLKIWKGGEDYTVDYLDEDYPVCNDLEDLVKFLTKLQAKIEF